MKINQRELHSQTQYQKGLKSVIVYIIRLENYSTFRNRLSKLELWVLGTLTYFFCILTPHALPQITKFHLD